MRKECESKIIDVFVARDGKRFYDQYACEYYEEQLRLSEVEQKAEKLKVDYANNADFPSMCEPIGRIHEYHWYRVSDPKDLELMCKTYESVHRDFKDMEYVKMYIQNGYPDYMCIITYPDNPSEIKWYTLSYLQRRLGAFFSQFEFDEQTGHIL